MIKIRILQDGVYGSFGPDRMGRCARRRGDEVVYPAWYAKSLVESGMAEIVVGEEVEEVVKPRPKASRRRVRKMGDAREITGLAE